MNKVILILIFLLQGIFCDSQSLDDEMIYATQFQNEIFLTKQLNTKVKKFQNSIIHILESNDYNQLTRELNRLSDSTFLYTEYYPMNFDEFIKGQPVLDRIYKKGILVISNETIIDTTVMWDSNTFEPLPSPRTRKILKQKGEWVEKNSTKGNKIKGSFNSEGKTGEWTFYSYNGAIDKVVIYEKGILIKEEYRNILNYKSVEKSKAIIQNKWVSHDSNSFRAPNSANTSSYEFKENGIFVKTSYSGGEFIHARKGKWSMIDFETLEFTVLNRKSVLKLAYLKNGLIYYKELNK